ncbi:hypothetical protein CC78DRAFT_541038 [Lojkania enalia]|uniref:LisH domain-containing protein n=1 Tax=Lojkania enalia TaxID=147567 RepID=A0A9P4KHM7_9PLEO|nr:hypothetical protein CC78DRAFT_541038 [Didymosphaeria enalia]
MGLFLSHAKSSAKTSTDWMRRCQVTPQQVEVSCTCAEVKAKVQKWLELLHSRDGPLTSLGCAKRSLGTPLDSRSPRSPTTCFLCLLTLFSFPPHRALYRRPAYSSRIALRVLSWCCRCVSHAPCRSRAATAVIAILLLPCKALTARLPSLRTRLRQILTHIGHHRSRPSTRSSSTSSPSPPTPRSPCYRPPAYPANDSAHRPPASDTEPCLSPRLVHAAVIPPIHSTQLRRSSVPPTAMQSQQMAAMGMNANMGGPVDGTPIMANAQRQKSQDDSRAHLNTYIYDYFKRNNHGRLAKMMIECDLSMNLNHATKRSPNGRNVNGVDAMDGDMKDDLPAPNLPEHQLADNSFLMDWWCQFWDIWTAARQRSSKPQSMQYITHTRSLAQLQTEGRNQRMMMNNNGINPAQYQNMMRGIPNGVTPNDMKRAAAMNNRNPGGNPMANMNQMKNQAMLSAQMQRDGSQMDMNGQRPQSPGSAENAQSPNKRPRVDGPGMNSAGMAGNQFNEFGQQGQSLQQKPMEVYAQSLSQQHRNVLNNQIMSQQMNAAVQGSPMPQQGLDGHSEIFAGNQPRPGMPGAAPGQPQGNHALQDYQMQLMLLEQQNKKRLLMARQEQDNMSGGPPHGQAGVGAPGFPPAMSPQGSRAGPSPNPTEQMKRGTPKMNQQGLPGSPMPDAAMQQQRNSPAPNMGFDPTQMPGVPPQYAAFPQMPQNQMMRPPSSHPGANFGGQFSAAQMEAMRRNNAMQNGAWQGPPQAMMQNPGQQMGGPMNNQQQRNQMPPPPAPPAGEQPRPQEPSPSQPAQAPPTPSQTNKANPKKKPQKENKKPAKAKGAGTGATPAASSEDPPPTPTSSTPITPMHAKPFGPNGQQQPAQPPVPQTAAPPPQQQPMDNSQAPFGSLGDDTNLDLSFPGFEGDSSLDTFDFDSFLHTGGDDAGGYGSLVGDFNFGDGVEAGGELA